MPDHFITKVYHRHIDRSSAVKALKYKISNTYFPDRVKDTDFGDIFDLSPISVLFTQILYEGVSYRYL